MVPSTASLLAFPQAGVCGPFSKPALVLSNTGLVSTSCRATVSRSRFGRALGAQERQ